MLKQSLVNQMSQRIRSYIDESVILAGAERREEVLDLFDKMHMLFPHWVVMTCPVMHPEIHYISKNYPSVLGHAKDYVINGNVERYFDHIHEADQEDVHKCFDFVHDFLESVPPEEHCHFRCMFYYRFRKQNGQYIHIHDEKAVLNLPGSGNLYYVLFRDITADKNFTGVRVDIFKQEEILFKIKEFKPSAEKSTLSRREGELVTLIKQGLSTKEIAWYLKISHNTVRNIKSKLFEKYKVNNTVELLNMTA